MSTIDDLNYPEKTMTYYIVNAPYIFSACWKVCPYILFLSFKTIVALKIAIGASCKTKYGLVERRDTVDVHT